MPKILLINNYHYRRGGADVVYLEQARLLRERGWKVVELAMRHPQNEASEYSGHFVEEIEYGRQNGWLQKLRHAAKVVYSREAAREVESLIRQERPDVVHAHNVYHHLSPAVLHAANRNEVPVVLTAHDLKLLCPAIGMYSSGSVCEDCRTQGRFSVVRKRCQKDSLPLSALVYVESTIHDWTGIYRNSVDRMISPSRFLIEKFAEWGWQGAPFSHIPNFVDITSMQPSYEAGQHFLYFGRLAPEKGLATLIDAVSKSKTALWMVGTGPDEMELRLQAERLGANVRFLGYQTGPALWELVRSCRAVVVPSKLYENAPLTVIEAYACGKPVLGARIGGIPELIRPGETGALFASGDSDELASALREYANKSPADIAELGIAARAWAEEEFTVEKHVSRLFEAYGLAGARLSA